MREQIAATQNVIAYTQTFTRIWSVLDATNKTGYDFWQFFSLSRAVYRTFNLNPSN
jgi:hypothetical protein